MVKRFRYSLVLSAPALVVISATFAVPILLLLFGNLGGGVSQEAVSVDYLKTALGQPHLGHLVTSLAISIPVVALCLLLGVPYGWLLARTAGAVRACLTIMLLLPILTSEIVIAYGWLIILGRNGLLNKTLLAAGVVDEPLALLFTPLAVILGLAALLIPFVALPVATAFAAIDPTLYRAATSLGAPGWRQVVLITMPLIRRSVVAGASIVYALSMSAYAVPKVLGGGRVSTTTTYIYSQYLVIYNPGLGAALTILLLIAVAIPLAVFSRGGSGNNIAGHLVNVAGRPR